MPAGFAHDSGEDAAPVVHPRRAAVAERAVEADLLRLLPVAQLLDGADLLELGEPAPGLRQRRYRRLGPLIRLLGGLHRGGRGPGQVGRALVASRSGRSDESEGGPRRRRAQGEQGSASYAAPSAACAAPRRWNYSQDQNFRSRRHPVPRHPIPARVGPRRVRASERPACSTGNLRTPATPVWETPFLDTPAPRPACPAKFCCAIPDTRAIQPSPAGPSSRGCNPSGPMVPTRRQAIRPDRGGRDGRGRRAGGRRVHGSDR